MLLDKVREGQVAGVAVTTVTSHDEREGTDAGWPQNVGVAGGLGATLQSSLVDRA